MKARKGLNTGAPPTNDWIRSPAPPLGLEPVFTPPTLATLGLEPVFIPPTLDGPTSKEQKVSTQPDRLEIYQHAILKLEGKSVVPGCTIRAQRVMFIFSIALDPRIKDQPIISIR